MGNAFVLSQQYSETGRDAFAGNIISSSSLIVTLLSVYSAIQIDRRKTAMEKKKPFRKNRQALYGTALLPLLVAIVFSMAYFYYIIDECHRASREFLLMLYLTLFLQQLLFHVVLLYAEPQEVNDENTTCLLRVYHDPILHSTLHLYRTLSVALVLSFGLFLFYLKDLWPWHVWFVHAAGVVIVIISLHGEGILSIIIGDVIVIANPDAYIIVYELSIR